MKNYEKPVILANSELSEGVYAGSGKVGAGCYSYDGYTGGDRSGDEGFYEYNVKFKHTQDPHMNCTHYFVVYFDSTPESAVATTNTDRMTATINGNSVTLKGQQTQANPGESCDIGMKIKWVGDVYGKPTGGYGYNE